MIFYRFPARKICVIGITGTDGKTTTANLLAEILQQAGQRVALATTINFRLAGQTWVNLTKQTTLSHGGVNHFLAQAVRQKCQFAILEVSSHALTQFRVLGVKFQLAILTNLTREHLDFHKTFTQYRAAKQQLFRQLQLPAHYPCQAILPAENFAPAKFLPLPKSWPQKRAQPTPSETSVQIHSNVTPKSARPRKPQFPFHYVTFGLQKGAFRIREIKSEGSLSTLEISSQTENCRFQTGLRGQPNQQNILAAFLAARILGLPLPKITAALKLINFIPGRFETIEAGQNFQVIVDFAHTPAALTKLLKTFRPWTQGKIWLVFGATGERDRGKRPLMGKIAAQLADKIVLTSDDPFHEDPRKIIREVAQGIQRRQNFWSKVSRRAALEFALNKAQAGDTVLLAGKGCERFQVVGNKKIPWDERQIARQILQKRFKAPISKAGGKKQAQNPTADFC